MGGSFVIMEGMFVISGWIVAKQHLFEGLFQCTSPRSLLWELDWLGREVMKSYYCPSSRANGHKWGKWSKWSQMVTSGASGEDLKALCIDSRFSPGQGASKS